MLADDSDSVDPFDGFGHGGADTNAVLGCLFTSHVVERKLVDVEGYGLQFRSVPRAVQAIAVKQTAHEDVCVRVRAVDVENAGYARTGTDRLRERTPSGDGEPVSTC